MTVEPSDAPVSREVALDVGLPEVLPVARVEIRRIRMAAGHPAGLHVHNGPVVGSIVAGSVWFELEGRPGSRLLAGDVFYEPAGARVTCFDAGRDGVEFLAYFPLSPGQEPAITFPDS